MLGLYGGEHGVNPAQLGVSLVFHGSGLQPDVGMESLGDDGFLFPLLASAGCEKSGQKEEYGEEWLHDR